MVLTLGNVAKLMRNLIVQISAEVNVGVDHRQVPAVGLARNDLSPLRLVDVLTDPVPDASVI
jgi:hypothetical protein